MFGLLEPILKFHKILGIPWDKAEKIFGNLL